MKIVIKNNSLLVCLGVLMLLVPAASADTTMRAQYRDCHGKPDEAVLCAVRDVQAAVEKHLDALDVKAKSFCYTSWPGSCYTHVGIGDHATCTGFMDPLENRYTMCVWSP